MSEILRLLAGKTPVAVVHIFNPPVDKLAASVLAEVKFGTVLPTRSYHRKPTCPDQLVDRWLARRILPIDIGRFKYHGLAGSATELIAKELEMRLTSRQQQLVDLMNRNNRTGCLKEPFMSIPWMLREGFEYWTARGDRDECVRRGKSVIHVWLDVNDEEAYTRGLVRAAVEFPGLLKETEGCDKSPFTIREYLVHLCAHDYATEEIEALVRWWVDLWKILRGEKRAAREEAEALQQDPKLLRFQSGNFSGLVLDRVISRRLVKEMAAIQAVVIARNHKGQVTILARNLSLAAAAKELECREPNLWYVGPGFAVNGTPMYPHTSPTALTLAELVDILKRFPVQPVQSPQRHNRHQTPRKQ